MISRTFVKKTKKMILELYKSLVRPHLEYAVQAWSPHLRKDVNLIERVQRRATRMILPLRHLPYEQRLAILRLTTLETRRLRGDLIEVFKMVKGFVDIDYTQYFTLANSSLRGHSLKLFKPRFKLECGRFFFANRIVDEWNMLPEEVVSCTSVNCFKNKIDHYLRTCRGFI